MRAETPTTDTQRAAMRAHLDAMEERCELTGSRLGRGLANAATRLIRKDPGNSWYAVAKSKWGRKWEVTVYLAEAHRLDAMDRRVFRHQVEAEFYFQTVRVPTDGEVANKIGGDMSRLGDLDWRECVTDPTPAMA